MPDFRIQGALNFGSIPAPGDYYTAYANALSGNQQNYNNILTGYQNLSGRVMQDIQGIDASQRQDITDQYAGELGTQTQRLIDRGLGNTTVQNAIQRGLLANRDKANIELTNKTQDLNARYRSNMGLNQLGFMERVNFPYPDVDQYNRVAMMGGAVGGRMQDPNYRVGQTFPMGGFGGTRVNMPQAGGGLGSIMRSTGAGAAGTGGTGGGYFGGTGGAGGYRGGGGSYMGDFSGYGTDLIPGIGGNPALNDYSADNYGQGGVESTDWWGGDWGQDWSMDNYETGGIYDASVWGDDWGADNYEADNYGDGGIYSTDWWGGDWGDDWGADNYEQGGIYDASSWGDDSWYYGGGDAGAAANDLYGAVNDYETFW